MWYGVSSIAVRFLSYLLTPYLTSESVLKSSFYGEMSLIYSAIPFLNVIFTYGLETAYFRFSKNKTSASEVFNTSIISLLFSTTIFTTILLLFRSPLAHVLGVEKHPQYITWTAFIIALDALSALAFAKLRFEARPIKFASIRIAGIVLNIALTVFFLSVCPSIQKKDPNSFIGAFYKADMGVGYIIIANLVTSFVTLLLLFREFSSFKWKFNGRLWKEIMLYSSPLIIAGFAGMINETFDRIMLKWWSHAPTEDAAKVQVAIYNACYKLSILITLSVQAFRMAAEPFFFSAAEGEQPQRIYARVMKFFVITVCFMFLAVVLFLDIWKYFISSKIYWQGLAVVPILLFANMFLGIYYNLSIWYKVSNKTIAGAWVTALGASLTLLINYLFIPRFGYMACAWATFICYGSMMVVSYLWGQKNYFVPYPWKKLVAYMVISAALYGVYVLFTYLDLGPWVNRGLGLVLISLFGILILNVEKKEFENVRKKIFRKKVNKVASA